VLLELQLLELVLELELRLRVRREQLVREPQEQREWRVQPEVRER
jgi:hypothetical protein